MRNHGNPVAWSPASSDAECLLQKVRYTNDSDVWQPLHFQFKICVHSSPSCSRKAQSYGTLGLTSFGKMKLKVVKSMFVIGSAGLLLTWLGWQVCVDCQRLDSIVIVPDKLISRIWLRFQRDKGWIEWTFRCVQRNVRSRYISRPPCLDSSSNLCSIHEHFISKFFFSC